MRTVFCMDCERPTRLEFRPMEGEIITFSSCGAELEVIRLEPVELDLAYLKPMEREKAWECSNASKETHTSFPSWDWMGRRDL